MAIERTILNATRATVVGTRIAVADSFLMRFIGLLGRRDMESGSGLLIRPSSGVHTFGMLFPIDVVALDSQMRVLAVWIELLPWRISGVSWHTRQILELPPGTIAQSQIQVGDQLSIFANSLLTSVHMP